MINEQEGESSCRQTWKEQRRRSFKIGVASRAGFEGWLGQRAGINEYFDSSTPSPSNTKTHSTNHRRNTYTVTRKYLRFYPSKTSLSQQNGCRVFSMKSVRWLKTNGANYTPRRKRKPPPEAFSIVNFPFFVSYPRRYSCRLTIARLHKEICFRQSSIPNV